MDKNFYYTDGKERFGPFSVKELKLHNLTVDTLVWAEGMGDWKAAGQVPELRELFIFDPPPVPGGADDPFSDANTYQNTAQGFNQQQQQHQNQTKPKNYLVESILVLLFCCWPLAIPAIINAANVDSRFNAGDYQGAQEASDKARKWMMAAMISGLVVIVIYLIVMFSVGFNSYSYY